MESTHCPETHPEQTINMKCNTNLIRTKVYLYLHLLRQVRIILLYPLSMLYGWVVAWRNFMFDHRLLRSVGFDTPIINVGNLSAGGTGKTPHVLLLAELLKPRHVAVLSRGYGRAGKEFMEVNEAGDPRIFGDEPLMMKNAMPANRFFVCADRVVGFTWIMHDAPETEVVLLDDAYQHRYIKPSLNILLTTWDQPFTRDYLLPSGMLRESRNGAKRADLIIVTKCPEQLQQEETYSLVAEISKYAGAPVCFSSLCYAPAQHHVTGEELMTETRVVVVSGIAQPQRFHQKAGEISTPVFEYFYPDHHAYNVHNIRRIIHKMKETGASGILTTEKDYVKFRNQEKLWQLLQDQNIYVLKIRPVFCFGGEDVVKAALASSVN